MVQEGNKKYVRMFTVFPFMCFVNSQIWLNWLTNDCHLGYIKNLIFFFFFWATSQNWQKRVRTRHISIVDLWFELLVIPSMASFGYLNWSHFLD
jgi:hypothetical protein